MRRRGLLPALVSILVLIGCQPQSQSLTPTADTTEAPSQVAAPPTSVDDLAHPTAAPAADTPTPAATQPLPPANGPWLIFTAPKDETGVQYLWKIAADGQGAQQLSTDRVQIASVRPLDAGSPAQVAYVTSADTPRSDLTLKLLTLPDGQPETITALTSAETALTTQDPNDPSSNYWEASNIADAIQFPQSVVWSPDGKWLAFVGAMDGSSADVYSYEAAAGQIRHLTSGADQAYQLLWSPDSRWIVHTAQKEFERSGGAFEAATGIWAAAPDGSAVNQLDGARAAQLLGWLGPDTLVVEGGPRMGPGGDLRLIALSAADVTDLEPSCYEGFAYDLADNVYLVNVTDFDIANCPPMDGWKPGLFLVSGGQRTPIPVQDLYDIRWSASWDMFFASQQGGNALVAISPSGEVMPSSYIASLPALSFTASGDGSLRAWADGDKLYLAHAPDFKGNFADSASGPITIVGWTQ